MVAPELALTAASLVLAEPFTLKKFPPKYTREFVAAMPRT
jgi:hypothetical protein